MMEAEKRNDALDNIKDDLESEVLQLETRRDELCNIEDDRGREAYGEVRELETNHKVTHVN